MLLGSNGIIIIVPADYRLVIVCSKGGEDHSLLISKLFQHKKSLPQNIYSEDNFKMYLKHHFIQDSVRYTGKEQTKASSADFERSVIATSEYCNGYIMPKPMVI